MECFLFLSVPNSLQLHVNLPFGILGGIYIIYIYLNSFHCKFSECPLTFDVFTSDLKFRNTLPECMFSDIFSTPLYLISEFQEILHFGIYLKIVLKLRNLITVVVILEWVDDSVI